MTALSSSLRLVLRWIRNGVSGLNRYGQLFLYSHTLLMREQILNGFIETMDILFKEDSGGILQEFVEMLFMKKYTLSVQSLSVMVLTWSRV